MRNIGSNIVAILLCTLVLGLSGVSNAASPLLSLGTHATLGVWFMTLLIQRTEHRDTQALQAKLDELLHAHSQANNAITKIDDEEPEDIVRHRTQARATD